MNRFLALAAALSLPAAAATAHDYRVDALSVLHPVAFATPVTARTGAGYLVIVNDGATPDALVGVRADFPQVMLHTTEEKDGIASMVHLDRVEIPAGGTVEFAPGGRHVMFMGLGGDPFEPGEDIPATLIFEQAGELDVVFTVVPREEGADHTGHAPAD